MKLRDNLARFLLALAAKASPVVVGHFAEQVHEAIEDTRFNA